MSNQSGDQELPQLGMSVVDENNPGSKALVVDVGGNAEDVMVGETGRSVADENPNYPATATVVDIVFVEDLETAHPDWKDQPFRVLRDRVCNGSTTVYSYPAPRVVSADGPNGTHSPRLWLAIQSHRDAEYPVSWGAILTDKYGVQVGREAGLISVGKSIGSQSEFIEFLGDAAYQALTWADGDRSHDGVLSLQTAEYSYQNYLKVLESDDPENAVRKDPELMTGFDWLYSHSPDIEISHVGVASPEGGPMEAAARGAAMEIESQLGCEEAVERKHRARDAYKTQSWECEHVSGHEYRIKEKYTVNLAERTCSCPDGPWTCKHIYYAELTEGNNI